MADEGLAKKDRICQFFASNAGLHFRSVDVAAALGLDARSVGQQLARLWRSGFVEKVQTGPFTTWRMKFQTYPGRNLHGPAAPKPACLTPHTPAKKSTRGSRTHEEGRNDSGHCAMGSPVVLGLTEGGNEEGEEDETDDQGSCLVEAHSVRVPEYHSSSSKPPAATRDGPTSTQNISSQCKAAENPPIKKTVGRPPGNKNKMSTSCRVGQKGSKIGKTSSTSGSCKKTTSAAVKRKVGPESFRKKNADQRTGKGKKTTSQITSREDCSSRSGTDSESSSLKIVPTGLKRKLGVESKYPDQGLKKKVKKTKTQTTEIEDCRGRSATDSSLSTQVQKKTHLMPTTVLFQKNKATAVKKKTDQEQKRRMKKATSPNTEGYSSSTCSTSGEDSLQHKPSPMPATLAPSLNRPSGNMETKLMNFIREAQGMLVMTGDDVAKALGSKPKETHRLLLHMQRTGRVRKVCDKPTRWMMLGQGRGGPARKRQIKATTTTTTQQKELPSLTTAQQREPLPQTQHQVPSTQTYRSFSIDGSPTRRRQEKATTTQQKEPLSLTKYQLSSTQISRSLSVDGSLVRRRQVEATTTTQKKEPSPRTKHQVSSTQIYRSFSTDGSTEEGTSKTSSSTRNLSECGQVYGMRFETQTSLCEEEEEGSEEIVSTSTQVSAEFGTCLATVEEEDLEDFSCVSQEEDSGFLDDVTFYAERNKSSPTVQQASISLPNKKQSRKSNQKSQGEDISCVFHEQDSGFLEDATFYTERKKPSPTVQQASSLPSKKQSRKSNQKSQGEDISCVFQEQDSGFLDDVTFYAERNTSVQQPLSLPSSKQNKTSNQKSQVSTTTRRLLSPCGKYVKKTPVKKQVLSNKWSVRKTIENSSSCSKLTSAKSTSLEGLQSQKSNDTGVSSTSCHAKKLGLSNFRIPKKSPHPGKQLGNTQLTVGQNSGDVGGGKRMSVAPSELDISLLDSKKDSTGKNKQDNIQRDISTIKTPPHILKHSVSYFASTTKEPDIKPKLPRPSKTTKDIPKLQDKTERSFERTKDNSVSPKEPLADIDVMVDVTVDKSPQFDSQLHSCGTCSSNQDLQHSPLSVLRKNSNSNTPTSGPPKLYPHRATESIGKQCMVGTLGSRDSPPILVHQEEELRSLGTESPALRAARRNLYPCFSLEESLNHQQRSTSCTSIHEQSGYKEDEHTGFRRGLVETVVSVTPGSGYFPLTDTDTKRKQQQLTACPHDWLLNKVNDRKIAGRCGGQKNVSGPESFSSEIEGTKESFSSSQDTGTDPRRAHGRGVYAELQDTSRVTRHEVIGHASHGSWESTFTSLHEQQCGKGLSCSQGQIRNNRQANFTSLEPKRAVAKATNAGVGCFIDTKLHRMTSIDERAHHVATNPIYSQGLIGNNRQANLNSLEPGKTVSKARPGEKASFSPKEQHRMTGINDGAHHVATNPCCSQGLIGNNRQANLNSLEPGKTVSKARLGEKASFNPTKEHRMADINGRAHYMGHVLGAEQSVRHPLDYHRTGHTFTDTKQHRMTDIDGNAHCMDPVPGAEVLVHHPPGYHIPDHTCSVHQMDSSGQGRDRQDLGRPQGYEKVHQALTTRQAACFEVPAPREVPRISVGGYEEKLVRGTIDLTQEKKFTKTSWPKPTDYWCDGVQDVFHAEDRKLSSGTEELLTTGTYTASETKARRRISSTEKTVAHTTIAHTASDNTPAKVRNLLFGTEEVVPHTTSPYTESEAKARKCISSTEETVPHTATAHTARDNILPAKVRNLLFGTEKAVPDITSMHTASEDVFPAIARRLSFGTEETVPQTTSRHTTSEGVLAKARGLSFDAEVTVPLRSTYTASEAKTMLSPGAEETVPHTITTHTARSNVGHSCKSHNVSILEEQALHAKVSNSPAQNGILCKVSDASIRNSERVTSTSCDGDVEPFHVMKSMQPSRDCSTTANHKGASTQASRSSTVQIQPSSTGSVPVLGADHHVHCIGVKQTPLNPEGLCISEKSQKNESTRWQRPRSPKSFWIDYWSKTESKDTKSDDLKDRSAENSRLVACSTTNADNVVSPTEPSSDLMKKCSQNKVCAKEVLSKDNANLPDEKSLTVSKEERKIFRTAETQTSEGFVDTSPIQRDKIANMRPDSKIKGLSDDVDIKVSLEEKVFSAVTSLTGPVEQSSWTQPKALYTTDERRPQEQKGPQSQEPRGQEVMDEAKGDDRSQVEPRGQEETVRDEVTSHEGSEVSPSGQEQAAGDKVRCDGSEVGQVSRHQVSVAMVTPQGSRPVVMAAQPSGTSLHPAQPVPVSQQSHPIVQLNELCQRNHLPMCFQDISVTGPAHRPRVQVAAVVGDCTFQAEASSKKAARRQAAREALQALYREGYK